MNYINKDTKIYGSFSIKSGNNGCKTFNSLFKEKGIDAIYKSFSVDNIELAVQSAKILKFSGFAVSMPYKSEVLEYVDEIDEDALNIGAANTVINKNGILKAYNTDFMAIKELLSEMSINSLYIIGNGGFAKAVQYACEKIGVEYLTITRENFADIKFIKNSNIINCTPVSDITIDGTNCFIDSIPTTETGRDISKRQSKYQFELYTNK